MKNNIFLPLFIASVMGCTETTIEPVVEKSVIAISINGGDTIYNNRKYSVTANVSVENVEITKVDMYVDGQLTKTKFSEPYAFEILSNNMTTGEHEILLSATGSDNTFKTSQKNVFFKVSEGEKYMGGVVVKLNQDKKSGIIASESDLSGGLLGKYRYGVYNDNYGAYSLDDGLANTNKFAGKFDANFAAIACLNLEYNGFSDWYLPALNELKLFEKFRSQLNIPERSGNAYWSSTESSTEQKMAFGHSYGALMGQPSDKQTYFHVRPVRRF